MTSTTFFVIIKPDAIRRSLVGEIISRFEKRGFVIQAARICRPTQKHLVEHYRDHSDKSYFSDLILFMSSGPVMIMSLKGNLDVARQLIGATIPSSSVAGTIRGDYSCNLPENLVHCSDDATCAARELELWTSYFQMA